MSWVSTWPTATAAATATVDQMYGAASIFGRTNAEEPDKRAHTVLAAGDHVHRDAVGAADELVREGAPQQLRDKSSARASEHDLGHVLEPGVAQELGSDVARRERGCVSAERLGKLHRLVDVPARCVGELVARLLDGHGDPGRVHDVGKALCRAHDQRRVGVGADAGKDALARGPRAFDGLRLHVLDEVGVDAFGGATQGELAQRRQVLRLEEPLAGAVRHVGHINLALREPLQKLLGRQVDQYDFVGFLEHPVGHRLAHLYAGDLLENVVQPFEVLNVERGPYVDARRQQLLDILPPLGMAAAGNVAVRQLIDEQKSRLARERLVEVELTQDLVDVDRGLARDGLEAFNQSLRLAPSVRLDETEDDLAPHVLLGARCRQHGKRLADAGSGAQKNLETAARLLAQRK